MSYENKSFDELSTVELFEIYRARVAVFVVEQNCPYQEVDDIDPVSRHMFIRDEEGRIKSYLRVFMRDKDTVQIGRVLTTDRGKGYGSELLSSAVDYVKSEIAASRIYLEAQTYATGFYEREGFVAYGEEFLEDGIPHICMELTLNK